MFVCIKKGSQSLNVVHSHFSDYGKGMKGWHCQGQRAVAKVYAELQGPGQKHSPGLRAQGHPQEGGAMGAGNER